MKTAVKEKFVDVSGMLKSYVCFLSQADFLLKNVS